MYKPRTQIPKRIIIIIIKKGIKEINKELVTV